MRLGGLIVAVLAGCVETDSVDCGDGWTCPAGNVCDSQHLQCVDPRQLELCGPDSDGVACTLVAIDDAVCDRGVCLEKRCGDGYRRDNEECDLTDLPGDANCNKLGFYFQGAVTCNDACNFDTSTCTGFCGDGEVTPGVEVCDGTMSSGETCIDFGYGTGTLGCLECGADVRACVPFGWELTDLPADVVVIHGSADDDVFALLFDGGNPVQPNSLAHFNGTSWTPVSLAGCGIFDYDILLTLWSPARGVVFAGGDDGTMMRLDGTTCNVWTIANGAQVQGVWASSPTDAWASTYNGGVHRFDGTNWSESLAPTADSLHLIWGSGPNDVYVTVTGVGLRHFTNGTWSAPVAPGGIAYISTIWGTSSNDVYVGNALGPKVVRFGGVDWATFLDSHPILAGPSPTIARGYSSNGRTFVLGVGTSSTILVHDGTGWSDLDPVITGGGGLWASTDGRVLTSALNGRISRYWGSGQVDFTELAAFPYDLVARAADDAFVVTQQRDLFHWDGAAWTEDVAVGEVYDVALAPDNTMFAVGPSGLWYRARGGTLYNDTTTTGDALYVYAADEVWVASANTVTRWTPPAVRQPFTFGPNDVIYDVYAASSSVVFAAGGNNSNNASVIRIYNGSAWAPMSAPAGCETVLRLWGRGATDVYGLCRDGGVIHYDGAAWTDFALPVAIGRARDLWWTSTELFVSGEGGLFRYNGSAWSPVDLGSPVGAEQLTGTGSSLLVFDEVSRFHQITRLVPWP